MPASSPPDFTCIACGGRRHYTRLSAGEVSIIACKTCDLGQTLPSAYVQTSHYDDAPDLSASYNAREHLVRSYARQLLDWSAPFVKPGKLLDVGCSIGALVHEAQARGFDAQGIDLDRHGVSFGQQKGLPLHQTSLDDWHEANYNVLTLNHTLEHIPEPLAFLAACRERLAPGGALVIAVPCHVGLNPRILGRRWYGWQLRQHYFHYAPRALHHLFLKANLVPARIFQTSMDHRHLRKSRLLAWLGDLVHKGDQLIAIATRPV